MTRPIIGVTSNYRPHEGEQGNFSLDRSYTDAVYKTGGLPQIIPILPNDEIESLIQMYDGILCSGGGGLLPEIKAMDELPGLKEQNPQRYEFEYNLIKAAIKHKIPILGICRGHQMINDVYGGTVMNLPTKEHRQKNPSDNPSHNIELKEETRLFNSINFKTIAVNSFHSQVIRHLGENLSISAYSEDGYIEAIEHTDDTYIVGVQFHPEFMIEDGHMYNIYSSFIRAARTFKNKRG